DYYCQVYDSSVVFF
nr:immunoglobulin light chain junction region [Macaca mulatta]MOX17625.1 immunoglobulin light chain junction region [Macaca mulatta]MOX18363.1 immunoglobulin light chain junction region [Macaca mulatta]MOX18549.1 immunoglobulin light chain junction region [Macaca mulatta]MOX19640.1 immunoglobulin light chain junction region [Macaca mulatta]